MQTKDQAKLLEFIDHLINLNQTARSGTSRISMMPSEDDVEKILELGVYPPDDPTSTPRLALFAVGETLGAVGGFELMKQVYDAYEANYGPQRAASLSVRWDTAAGVWHD